MREGGRGWARGEGVGRCAGGDWAARGTDPGREGEEESWAAGCCWATRAEGRGKGGVCGMGCLGCLGPVGKEVGRQVWAASVGLIWVLGWVLGFLSFLLLYSISNSNHSNSI